MKFLRIFVRLSMPALAAFVALVAIVTIAPAHAATCTVSATGVSLGSYTPNQAAPADSAGRITIACNKGALDTLPSTVTYSLSISRGSSNSYTPRELKSGPHALQYNLYYDALRGSVWGDATGGTSRLTGALPLQPVTATETHSIYGRIFAGQNVWPGAYADSLVVTIDY